MAIYQFPFYLFLPVFFRAALVDEREARIPNEAMVGGLLIFGLTSVVFALACDLGPPFLNPGDYRALWLDHLVWGMGSFLALVFLAFLSRGGMGMGDVKLLGLVFLFLMSWGLFVFFLALVFTLARFVFWRVRKKAGSKLPFAPSLFMASLVFLFLSWLL